jgi:hypothetical protein
MTTDNTTATPTMYMRLLDKQTISTLQDMVQRHLKATAPNEHAQQYEAILTQLAAVQRLPDLERKLAEVWKMRAREFKLKPTSKAYTAQGEAYLQGMLAALTLLGYTTYERADMAAFFVQAGRMDTILDGDFRL